MPWGNGNQNGGVSCGWVRRYHFRFKKSDMTQSCSWKLTHNTNLLWKKLWMSSKFMTFFNQKYKSLQVQCWSFVLKMSHLKFNIPHLDLLAGYLQGPSVPDGGVGSARRGREALQWRTSGGYHCWVTGISYQIWRESGSSFGAGVLIHANWSPKSELEKWFLNCISAKPDSLVNMIVDINNMTWHYMISAWKHDNMLTTTTPVPLFLPWNSSAWKPPWPPCAVVPLPFASWQPPKLWSQKIRSKKRKLKNGKGGVCEQFTIDVRPQLDNYIRSSARFFRRCCVFFTRIVPFISFIREHLQAVALALYNLTLNAATHITSIYSIHRFNFQFLHPSYVGKPPSYDHTLPPWQFHTVKGWGWRLSTSLAAALNKEGWEMVEGSWAWNFPQNLKVTKSPWRMVTASENFLKQTWKMSGLKSVDIFLQLLVGVFVWQGHQTKKTSPGIIQKGTFFQPPACLFLEFPKCSPKKKTKKHSKKTQLNNLTICFPQVVTFRSTSSWGIRTIQDFTSEGDIKSYFRSWQMSWRLFPRGVKKHLGLKRNKHPQKITWGF